MMLGTLFERLRSDGENLINEMIEGEYQETLTLDFKANVHAPGNPLFSNDGKKLTTEGRKTVAVAASAFANSIGGILILGVDCRDIDGVDAAHKITPICELSRALTTINNELHSITIPSIMGIEAIRIFISNGSSGIIAISIPRSNRRPHRSNAKGARSYFKRSGTSNTEMEHYELQDAFLSNLSPELTLTCELSSARPDVMGGRTGEQVFDIIANLYAKNTGGGTAKYIFLECQDHQGLIRHLGGKYGGSKNQITKIDDVYQAATRSDFFIHPGTKCRIESFEIQVCYNSKNNEVRIGNRHFDVNSTELFVLEFFISAEGMRRENLKIEYKVSDLISAMGIECVS